MLHVASPHKASGTHWEIVNPALKGTLAVLEACRDFKLKKCVFTSDVAALAGPGNLKQLYNEKDWVDPTSNNISLYQKSKVLSEQLVWRFRDNLPEDSDLELVTINPGKLFGRFGCLRGLLARGHCSQVR